MADQPVARRRFQFRLRTLMIGVTLLAVPCTYVGWQAKIVREREAFLENRMWLSAEHSPSGPVQAHWMLRLLGAKSVYYVLVWNLADAERAASLFPEAIVSDMNEAEGNHMPQK
jgi:hypothetical protein